MPKSSIWKYGIVAVCAIGLLLVRGLETVLFYDPLTDFFKRDYLTAALPEISEGKMFLGLSGRYWLNSAFSLLIIAVLFPKKPVVKFCGWLYIGFFILLILLFFAVLSYFPENKFLLFYVRRFLIQPLLLLLFLPALYYQEKVPNK